MLGHPHPVRRSAHDLGHLVSVEIAQHPEQHDFGLILREQFENQRHRILRAEVVDGLLFRCVRRFEPLEHATLAHVGAAPDGSTSVIDQPTTSDREHPRPKPRLITAEPADARGHRQPHISRQIVGHAWLLRAKKSQQPGLQVTEQHSHRPLLTLLGGGQYRLELPHTPRGGST